MAAPSHVASAAIWRTLSGLADRAATTVTSRPRRAPLYQSSVAAPEPLSGRLPLTAFASHAYV